VFQRARQPVISVDAKKKEQVGGNCQCSCRLDG
jgi:hypothetical protein